MIYILTDNFLNEDTRSAYALSIIMNKVDFVELFYQYSPDKNLGVIDDNDIFDVACIHGSLDVVKYLIDKKIFTAFGPQDPTKNSLLHKAAKGNAECLKFVLSKTPFANTKHPESGFTPIYEAVLFSKLDNISLLLPKSDLSITDVKKRNLFHYVSSIIPASTSIEIAKLLLTKETKGDPLNAVDDEGFTPFDLALLQGNNKYAQFILENKGKPGLSLASSKKINPLTTRSIYAKGESLHQFNVSATVLNGRLYQCGGVLFSDVDLCTQKSMTSCDISDIKEEPIVNIGDVKLHKDQEFQASPPVHTTVAKQNGETLLSTPAGIDDTDLEDVFLAKTSYTPEDKVAYYEMTLTSDVQPIVTIGFLRNSEQPDSTEMKFLNTSDVVSYASVDGRLILGYGVETEEIFWEGPKAVSGDIMGIGYIFETGEIFYTKNGEYLGAIPYDLQGHSLLIPHIMMSSSGTSVALNFGTSPFKYNFLAPCVHWVKEHEFEHPINSIFTHPNEENTIIAIADSTTHYYKYNVVSKTVESIKTKPVLEGILTNTDVCSFLTEDKIFILIRTDTCIDEEGDRKHPYLYCLDLTTNEWTDWIAPHKKLIALFQKIKKDFTGYAHNGQFYIVQNDCMIHIDKSTTKMIELTGAGPSSDVLITTGAENCFSTSSSDSSAWTPFFFNMADRKWYLAQFIGNGIYPRESGSLAMDHKSQRCFISCGTNIYFDQPVSNLLDEVKFNMVDDSEGLLASFNNKEVSDAVVKAGDNEFHVSKAILASRSSYFKDFFASNSENTLTLDGESRLVEALLKYFYTYLLDFTLVTFEDKGFVELVAKYAPNTLEHVKDLLIAHHLQTRNTCNIPLALEIGYSDVEFTIEGESESIKAHKAIIFGRNKELYNTIQSPKVELKGFKLRRSALEFIKSVYYGRFYAVSTDLTLEELKDLLVGAKLYSQRCFYHALTALYTRVDSTNAQDLLSFGKEKNIEELESLISK